MLKKLYKINIGTVIVFDKTSYIVISILDNGLFKESHESLLTVKIGHLTSVKIITDKKTFNIHEILEAEIS
jgi:hypothetical protein